MSAADTRVLRSDLGGPIGPPARVRARRWVRIAAAVAVVLGVAVLVGAISASGPRGYLDPGSAGPEGAMALRVLLEKQGVHVTVVHDAAAAVAAAARRDTLFVPDTTSLSDDDIRRVWSTEVVDVVATDPDERTVPVLIPGTRPGHVAGEQVRDPACALHAATRAGPALTGGLTVTGQPLFGTLDSCYAAQGEGTVVRQDFGDGHTVTLLGSGTAFTNAELGADGNAALALNLLGGRQHLVWLVGSPTQAPPVDGHSDFTELLPPWVGIVVAQLVVVVLVTAAWRGRRLGPVVVEPLPVDVRAAETTEGRARLYRRRGARGRAAEHLRAVTLARLLGPLGLPPASGPTLWSLR